MVCLADKAACINSDRVEMGIVYAFASFIFIRKKSQNDKTKVYNMSNFFSVKQSYSRNFFLVSLKINNLLNFFFVPRVTRGKFLMQDNGADVEVAAALNRSLRQLNSRKTTILLAKNVPKELSLVISLLTLMIFKTANDEGI